VRVGEHHPIERELSIQVNLWSSITANERMDWLLEKATELGAATLLPITAERSVLKLKGERADKKLAHWQAIAVASSEQCGRNRVLQVGQATTLTQALEQLTAAPSQAARWVLSLSPGTRLIQEMIQTIRSTHDQGATQPTEIIVLSGPEGGLSPTEEAQAIAAGFVPVSLGNRVLRAETAPVAVLSAIACLE
jgi:16S rRNA (uracil1498-N3)-methyltransferase